MDKEIQLVWKTEPAQRAKRIPPETWSKHEAEIRAMYHSRTLEAIMKEMGDKHDFWPSKRQYVTALGKWGLRKYDTTKVEATGPTEPEVAQIPHPLSQSTSVVPEQVRSPGNDAVRRRHSFLSMQSARNSLSSIALPKKKKQRYEQDLVPVDCDVVMSDCRTLEHFSVQAMHSTGGPSQSSNDRPNLTLQICGVINRETLKPNAGNASGLWEDGNSDYDLLSDDPFQDDYQLTPTASLQSYISDNGTITGRNPVASHSDDSSSRVTADRSESLSSRFGSIVTGSQFSLPERWKFVDNLVRVARQVDSNQDILSYSAADIADMKAAADFLFVCRFFHEASYLYALVAKRARSDGDTTSPQAMSTLFNFAMSAESNADRHIVQSLLEDEINSERSDVIKFNWLMMTSFSESRAGERPGQAKDHLNKALDIFNSKDMLALLPEHDRTLDFATYINVLRCVCAPDLSTIQKEKNSLDVFGLEWDEFKRNPRALRVAQQFIRHSPGPFEIANDHLQNSCLRSCISWCVNELNCVKSLPGVWKRHRFTHLRKSRRAQKNTFDEYKFTISGQEGTAIFTCLWDRSRNNKSSSSTSGQIGLFEWMDSFSRMGLPALDLLHTVIGMTCYRINMSTWKPASTSRALISKTQHRLRQLLTMDDEALVLKFLDEHIYSNSLGPWQPEYYIIQDTYRAHALELCRKTMMIIVPERVSVAFTADGSPRMTFAEILPTLAPSLNSESLQRMRGMWGRSISNLSLSRHRASHRSTSHLSVSQLSVEMTNSLRI